MIDYACGGMVIVMAGYRMVERVMVEGLGVMGIETGDEVEMESGLRFLLEM